MRDVGYSSLLTLTETTIGNLLHAAHVPLKGHFLAYNQCLLMNLAIRENTSPIRMSVEAGMMKLTMGLTKRLTPMIAIIMQGLLFELGTKLCGRFLGSFLMSFWPTIQPLFFAYIIFGDVLFESLFGMPWKLFLVGLAMWNVIVSVGIVYLTQSGEHPWLERYLQFVSRAVSSKKGKVFHWIFRWPLLLACCLIGLFIYGQSTGMEDFVTKISIQVVRIVVGIGVIEVVSHFLTKYLQNRRQKSAPDDHVMHSCQK